MQKIVFATSNIGKINELKALFANISVDLIPQSQFGVSDVPETGLTFVENAILKARHAAKITGLPTIADDSGLLVNALYGAPGIYSARYAGELSSAENNIEKLLFELRNVPAEKRQAFFYCILVFLAHEKDPAPIICDGKWEGNILTAKRGRDGFGYDPIFYIPAEEKTAAELTPDQKNKMSHRGIAVQKLLGKMTEIKC